jgi:hypothetical protein
VAPIAIKEEADLYRDGCKGPPGACAALCRRGPGHRFSSPDARSGSRRPQAAGALSQTPVVAVDLPSGWEADSREFFAPEAYRADAVVTFTAPKLAHVSGMLTRGVLTLPGNLQQGPIVVAPIGSPAEAVESATGLTWAGSSKVIADRPRPADSNKGRFGHVLVIGGARGKSGRPLYELCRRVARRGGPGHRRCRAIDFAHRRRGHSGADDGCVARGSPGRNLQPQPRSRPARPILEKKSVIAVGPGWARRRKRSTSSWGCSNGPRSPWSSTRTRSTPWPRIPAS